MTTPMRLSPPISPESTDHVRILGLDGLGGSVRPPHRTLWAKRMGRVFDVEVLRCGVCHSLGRLIAVITQQDVIVKSLAHLELETNPPPVQPTRAPPQLELAF